MEPMESIEQSRRAAQDGAQAAPPRVEATAVRISASTLPPASAQQVDQQAEEQRRRQALTLGLTFALAVALTLGRKLWGWAQEERARARVNRELRRRTPAT